MAEMKLSAQSVVLPNQEGTLEMAWAYCSIFNFINDIFECPIPLNPSES